MASTRADLAVMVKLADITESADDRLILAGVMSTIDDPSAFFAWSDAAVRTLHGAATALPMIVAPPAPLGAIPPTTQAFKIAVLNHLAAVAAPGVDVIGNALGLTCTTVAAFGRVVTALSHLSDSPWAAALLATVPPGVDPLAIVYTNCAGAAGARGQVERVYPGGIHPLLFN